MKTVTMRNILLISFCIILFVLQDWFQQHLEVFQYADELFALLIVPMAVLRFLQKKFKISWTRERILFAVFLIVFWVSGWCGYFVWHYQPFVNTAKDSYVNIKFFLAAGASWLMFAYDDPDEEESGRMRQILWYVVNAVTTVLFVLCLADLFFGIFDADMRGGLRAVKLFYSVYTVLVGTCVFLCAICLWMYEEKRKMTFIPLAMLAFIMVSTRRVKAMGALACLVLIFLVVFRNRKKKLSRKVKIFAAVVVTVAGVAALYQTISYYFLMGTESARAVLTIGAPFIAADHFPFGTGWGTYGSAFSIEPYSPVYGMYWMAGIWGISQSYSSFVSDTFWPMILGQCGYFGFAALLGALWIFIKKVFALWDYRCDFASTLFLILYLLISSTSESAFANPVAVPMAFWIGFVLASHRKDREEIRASITERRKKRIRSRRQRRMRRRANKSAE